MSTDPIDASTIVGTLLRDFADLTAIVPVDGIKEEAVPANTPLPVLPIESVSIVERHPLKRGQTTRTIERVSVNIRAASHRDRKRIRLLVIDACAGKFGDIAGAKSVSIITAGAGPNMRGPGDSYDRRQDFKVTYDA